MPSLPAISDAEWDVMKILWDHPGQWLSAAQVVAPVSQTRGTHHRTARTLLARLVKKGAIESRPDANAGNAHLYRAKVPRDAVVRAESKTFLSRVFDGQAAPALVHLLAENKNRLSPQEIQELRDLLNYKERK